MPIKQRKPTNSASRFQTYLTFEEITRETPHKPLTEGKHASGGRNNRGQLTSWWRGGGCPCSVWPTAPNTCTSLW